MARDAQKKLHLGAGFSLVHKDTQMVAQFPYQQKVHMLLGGSSQDL